MQCSDSEYFKAVKQLDKNIKKAIRKEVRLFNDKTDVHVEVSYEVKVKEEQEVNK